MAGFEIFEMPAGQGRLALSPLVGRNGTYDADVAAVLAWRPALVVTLVEGHELALHGATAFGSLIAAQGAQWDHRPVKDFDTPDPQDALQWAAYIDGVAARLIAGERVLVHCLGGCGRSGMVVLRTLVALGEPADQALARLRARRPCAIETDKQMLWATSA